MIWRWKGLTRAATFMPLPPTTYSNGEYRPLADFCQVVAWHSNPSYQAITWHTQVHCQAIAWRSNPSCQATAWHLKALCQVAAWPRPKPEGHTIAGCISIKYHQPHPLSSANTTSGNTPLDILSPKRRSALMSRIQAKNTKPERVVRSILHALGYRFRLHDQKLPGTPDIVLAKHQRVILVHGCFFHSHKGCRLAYVPKTRTKFWRAKFASNVARDKKVQKLLREAGWKVTVVWECETRKPSSLSHRLAKLFRR
jgi:DNA mismatch endonuclease, patch repair protein